MKKSDGAKKVSRRRVVFTFFAPQAKEVLLMGDFNNWDAKVHPMIRVPVSGGRHVVLRSAQFEPLS